MFDFETLLNIKIDKIYCISIDSRNDRREYLKTQFEKFKNEVSFQIVQKHSDPIKGCLESHIQCIQDAKNNNYQNILIFEDDILINEKILTTIDNINIPNDFDMFYLGYHVNNGIKYGRNIMKIFSAQTTHAYIMNQQVFDFVLENINKDWGSISEWSVRNKYEKLTNFNVRAIDLFYSKWIHHHRNNSYAIYPILVYQKPDFSDIENRVIDYRNLMETKADEFYNQKSYNNEIWVLNLDKRLQRWKNTEEKIQKYDLNAFRISAIDGLTFNFTDYKHIFDLRDFKFRIKNPYKTHEFNKGVLGCALSHYKMWESIVNNNLMNNEDFVLILEDDCNFINTFDIKLNMLLDELKYKLWDICYIGYTDYVPLDDDIEEGKNLIKLSGSKRLRGGGTFGYLLTKGGAKKLYKLANDRCIQQAVDWFMIEQYDKIIAYKTKNDLVISNVAGVEGHDSDVQNVKNIFYDIKLNFFKHRNNIFLKDQYNNLYTIDEQPFKINYIGNLVNENKIEINRFDISQVKTKLSFKRTNEYIGLYVGNKMKIFIHYFAKYLQNKLQKKLMIFYDGYDIVLDNIQYINLEKFDKLNNVLKYSSLFLFDISMFFTNLIRPWNKIIIVEDGEFFYDNKYDKTLLPNHGVFLFQNLLKKVDKIISISKTNAHYFKQRTGLIEDIPILPPIFNDGDIFQTEDKVDVKENENVFISYDTDVKSIIKFFHTLQVKDKKLIIFSDVFRSTTPNIIIKSKIYKFNYSYLKYAHFFITESRLTDDYYALHLAYKMGLVCVIPEYFQELNNKTITFKNNLSEAKNKVESCFVNNKMKLQIYKKIGKSHILKLNQELEDFKLLL